MNQNQGFTFLEIMAICALLSILVAFALPSYQQYVKDGRLHEAKKSLLINAQFMEHWYSENGRFKATSTTWPTLPYPETEYFMIEFSSKAKGVAVNRYYLRATAKDAIQEPRYLTLDQFNEVKICDKSSGKVKCKAG